MGILLGIIGLLTMLLIVCFMCYKGAEARYDSICERLSKKEEEYNDLIYDYCVLVEKLKKIKELNLIDYENNQYYNELLTIK